MGLRSFLGEAHEGIFVFLCQFSEIFRAFLASFRFSRNFLCDTVTHVVSHSFSLIQNRTVDFCAKFANLGRKALHPSTQSIAIGNAKLCNRQRKALHKRCLHNQKWNLFLIYSDYLLAENTLTSTRCKRKSTKPRVPLRSTLGYVLLHLQRVLVNVCSASK